MICNTACLLWLRTSSKPLNTAKLLIEMQALSDLHFIKHETRRDLHQEWSVESLGCTKHIGINTRPKENSVRMVSKVCLEGRGNSDWRKVQDLRSCFRMDGANTFSLKRHHLHSGLCFLFLTTVAKYLDERECTKGLLSNWQPSSGSLSCTSF